MKIERKVYSLILMIILISLVLISTQSQTIVTHNTVTTNHGSFDTVNTTGNLRVGSQTFTVNTTSGWVAMGRDINNINSPWSHALSPKIFQVYTGSGGNDIIIHSNAAAGGRSVFYAGGSSSSDAYTIYNASGDVYSIGVDASDDLFKIAASDLIDNSVFFTADQNGNITFLENITLDGTTINNWSDISSSSGSPFNQSLNTTDNVQFQNLTINGTFIQLQGGLAVSGRAVSTDYTLTPSDYIIGVNTAGGHVTITVPDATPFTHNWHWEVWKISGDDNVVSVVLENGTQIIDKFNHTSIYNKGQAVRIGCYGAYNTYWFTNIGLQMPAAVNTTTDITGHLRFDYLMANTTLDDITVTFPTDVEPYFEGKVKSFFNTGNNTLIIDPNGNTIDGSAAIIAISPDGFLTIEDINGELFIVNQKTVYGYILPDDVPYLELWIDSSNLSSITKTSNNYVTNWADQSGNGNDFIATGAERPLWIDDTQNSRAVIHFNGTTNFMDAGNKTTWSNTRGHTVMMVVKSAAGGAANEVFIGKYNTNASRDWYIRENGVHMSPDGLYDGANGEAFTSNTGNYQIIEMTWTPGGPYKIYVNGGLSVTSTNLFFQMYLRPSHLTLGQTDFVQGWLDGEICELAIWSDDIDDDSRQYIRDNWAEKWGLSGVTVSGSTSYWSRDADTDTLQPLYTSDTLKVETLNITSIIELTPISTPATPVIGTIYTNITDSRPYYWNGSAWHGLI